MATDREDKQGNTASAASPDPAQAHYDREFNHSPRPENYDNNGVEPTDLREMEQEAGSDASDEDSSGSTSSSSAEETAEQSEEDSLFKNQDQEPSRFSRVKGKARKLATNKLFIGGSLLGGGGFIALFILAIVLLGSLKIPHLMEHITAYQFARVTRQMSNSVTRATAAKIVVDAADNSVYGKFKEKYYANPSSKVAKKWEKLDKYRPQKIVSNFDKNSTFKMEYTQGTLGRQRLVGITVEGNRSIPVQKPSGLTRFIPGVQFANDVRFATQVAPVLNTQLRANDVGYIIRGSVAKEIRQRAGISLVAWKVGQYRGKTPEQARLIQARAINAAVDDGKIAPIKTDLIKNAAASAKEVEKANIANDEKLAATLAAGGVDKEVLADLDKSLAPSKLGTALSIVNPVYAIAAPMCIIYEGSLTDSGPTINAQSTAQQKTYYYLASAADQQKNGYDVEAEAVGALNDQLGDITESEPERRAAGLKPNTSASLSTQASAGGSFSVLDAILPGPVAALGNQIGQYCPTLTAVETGVALGIANIALLIASFGSSAAAQGAVTGAVNVAVRALAQKLVTSVITKEGRQVAKNKATRILGNVAAVGGLTVLAKYITIAKMNSINNGLQTSTDLANAADSGGNLAANDLNREQFFGLPMSKASVIADASENQAWRNAAQENVAFSERYFALSNPDSLLTKTAISVTSMKSFTNILQRLATSIQTLPQLFGSVISGRSFAADSVTNANTYHGNVQWGFTAQEEALLKNDASYSFLDNQKILDESGREADIATEYAECFGYNSDASGNLSSGGPTVGDLLAAEKIVRDDEGNVVNDPGAKCSETNLSVNNRDYGDLVFRWRIANSDEITINQLTESQEPVPPSADVPASSPTSTPGAVSDVFGPSDNMTCPAGTQDGGLQDGYRKGQRVPIRLCIVNGIDVNAKIAANVQALIKDAESKGVKLSGGGFRTMAEQTTLYNRNCGGNPGCKVPTARPGYSNHQMGLAIDFIYGSQGSAICYPRSSANCSGNAGFNYLAQNAARYGLKNLPKEAWHWSVDGT